jgi:Something about silencing, SAS, complex subunit 4
LPSPATTPARQRHPSQPAHPASSFENPCAQLSGCQVLDLPLPKSIPKTDPLDEALYNKAHRRIERQEKQLRNIERERAQHEKVQLERLLDELQGHDWLRVMGISGVTETEKKLYEPKRALFVKEVSSLIEKFRVWKEEEKRRKIEREQTLLEAETEVILDAEPAGGVPRRKKVDLVQTESQALPSSSEAQSEGEPLDINDVDAWAARQLHQEARTASVSKRPREIDEPPPASPNPPLSPPPPQPFTSFYSKRYLRDAAIGHYRRGRMRTAFGLPIPEMPEREFQLPPDILTPDAINACMRKRRRLKRAGRGR